MFLKVRLLGSSTTLVNTDNIVSIDCDGHRVYTVDGKSHTLCTESCDELLRAIAAGDGNGRWWWDEVGTI